VPFFFALHSQDSFFTPPVVRVVDFPLPAGVPRILPASRVVMDLQAPFGAAAVGYATAGAAASTGSPPQPRV
jgi:hypothetical protein